MKKTQLLGLVGLSLAASGIAMAEIETSFTAGYATDYVWRGVNQSAGLLGNKDGLFHAGLDFTGAASCGIDWNAGLWLADFGYGEERNFYASASKSFNDISVEFGVIRYDFSHLGLFSALGAPTPIDTTELFLGVGYNYGGIDLAAKLYYDVDEADGDTFLELSAGKSFEVGAGVTLEVAANYGLTVSNDVDDYATYGLSATASKELTAGLTGSVFIAGELTEGLAGDGDDLYGGASLSYGF